MCCYHIVVRKWWRNVSPDIAAAPFCDQLTARQEQVLLCFVLFYSPDIISTCVQSINWLNIYYGITFTHA